MQYHNKINKNVGVSWRLTGSLDEQKQLFYNIVSTGYSVDAFLCICGHMEFIIEYQEQNNKYSCSVCENEYFNNATLAWENYHRFITQNKVLNLSLDYHILKEKDSIAIGYAAWLPQSIDLLRNRVVFAYKDICTLSIDKKGNAHKTYETEIEDVIFHEMEVELVNQIVQSQYFDLTYDRSRKVTLNKIRFSLQHQYLKSTEYYYWKEVDTLLPAEEGVYDIAKGIERISNKREEKSVKRAVYSEYHRQIKEERYFHPGCIYVFSRTIDDPNLLVRVLSLSALKYFEDFWIELESFIYFLKQQYSEKQIVTLFEAIEYEDEKLYLFYDTLDMLSNNYETITEYFHKTKCSVTALHDEFARCIYQNKINGMSEQFFVYSEMDFERCIYVNGYKVSLPKSNKDLYIWGEELHNCLLSYTQSVRNRSSLIYGFFNEDKLLIAVEIQNNQIVQASGKYNAGLDAEEKFTLYEWFGRFLNEYNKCSFTKCGSHTHFRRCRYEC